MRASEAGATENVIAGLVVAAAIIQGLSVAVGAAVGAMLPETLIGMVAGLAFLAVAAWTLRARGHARDPAAGVAPNGRRTGIGLAVLVAPTFFIGEVGDKTMLATFALAARQDPLAMWIGATAGIVAANLVAVAVAVGRQVGSRLSPRAVRIGSAALFALAGILVIVTALLG